MDAAIVNIIPSPNNLVVSQWSSYDVSKVTGVIGIVTHNIAADPNARYDNQRNEWARFNCVILRLYRLACNDYDPWPPVTTASREYDMSRSHIESLSSI